MPTECWNTALEPPPFRALKKPAACADYKRLTPHLTFTTLSAQFLEAIGRQAYHPLWGGHSSAVQEWIPRHCWCRVPSVQMIQHMFLVQEMYPRLIQARSVSCRREPSRAVALCTLLMQWEPWAGHQRCSFPEPSVRSAFPYQSTLMCKLLPIARLESAECSVQHRCPNRQQYAREIVSYSDDTAI